MIIKFGHVLVDDLDKALQFYTQILGFRKARDVPDGDSGMRFLTVVSDEGVAGFELELQGTYTAAARAYQQSFRADGFAYIGVETKDIQTAFRCLKERGVQFVGEPEDAGPVWTVKFDDNCGNLVNLMQVKSDVASSSTDNLIINCGQVHYRRLKNIGVQFVDEPEDSGPVWTVKFDDTCGNLINLIQIKNQ